MSIEHEPKYARVCSFLLLFQIYLRISLVIPFLSSLFQNYLIFLKFSNFRLFLSGGHKLSLWQLGLFWDLGLYWSSQLDLIVYGIIRFDWCKIHHGSCSLSRSICDSWWMLNWHRWLLKLLLRCARHFKVFFELLVDVIVLFSNFYVLPGWLFHILSFIRVHLHLRRRQPVWVLIRFLLDPFLGKDFFLLLDLLQKVINFHVVSFGWLRADKFSWDLLIVCDHPLKFVFMLFVVNLVVQFRYWPRRKSFKNRLFLLNFKWRDSFFILR